MKRRQDWPVRLAEAIDGARAWPFAWGRHDCVLFAAGCVRAMTGVDMVKSMRGYKTARGAARKLRGKPLGEVVAAVMADHGRAEVSRGYGQRGDVVLIETEIDGAMTDALGVIDSGGRHIACAAADGLVMLPVAAALRIWRI